MSFTATELRVPSIALRSARLCCLLRLKEAALRMCVPIKRSRWLLFSLGSQIGMKNASVQNIQNLDRVLHGEAVIALFSVA